MKSRLIGLIRASMFSGCGVSPFLKERQAIMPEPSLCCDLLRHESRRLQSLQACFWREKSPRPALAERAHSTPPRSAKGGATGFCFPVAYSLSTGERLEPASRVTHPRRGSAFSLVPGPRQPTCTSVAWAGFERWGHRIEQRIIHRRWLFLCRNPSCWGPEGSRSVARKGRRSFFSRYISLHVG